MEWITSQLEGENGSAIQLVLITAGLVLALIIVFWIFRRIAGTPARRAAKNRVPRLSITDFKDIGDKRHLILARRDNVEHLILIGGPNDIVVETGIVRTKAGNGTDKASKSTVKNIPTKAESAVTIKEEKPKDSGSKIDTAAVAGIATAAGAATTASQAVSSLTEDITDTVTAVKTETVEQVTETAETLTEAVSEPVVTNPEMEVVETIEIAEPITEAAPESVDLEIDFDESDLEATLSDALSTAPLAEEVSTDTNANEETLVADTDETQVSTSPDDEMQKLLAELASETKEPA